MFKKATRLKLRFETSRGVLTTEDLWDLPLQELNTIAKSLNKTLKSIEEEDFLEEINNEDKITKMQFDIVKHILDTKKDESNAMKDAAAKKIEKEKLLAILAKKQDSCLENLSEAELKKKINKL